ncbi:extracellular solute-binding protein [Streptomyces sp. 4N509B]|uniref:extracellular solute-binding protein n=1 Tax=Streptomyces sp. 4N509B TaxID=3457413 RepID=UPI003FCF357E
MPLTRRRLLTATAGATTAPAVAAFAAFAGGCVSGCAGPGGGAPDLDAAARVPTRPTRLRWWSFRLATNDGGDLRPLLVDAFRARHPHIAVELVEAPANTDITRSTISTVVASGAATPDLYMGDVIWPAQFAYNALTLPLGTLAPPAFWQRYPAALVRALSYEGEPHAFPFYADQPYLYYRTDLLDRHGLPAPTTWEELADAAERIVDAGDAEVGLALQGAVYEGLTCNVAEFVADAGGTLLDPAGRRVTLGGEPGRRALAFLDEAVARGVVPSATATFREQDTTDAFTAGEAAFLRNWAYVWDVVNAPDSPVRGRVGVAPRPGFAGLPRRGHGCLGGWCNIVNPHSAHLGAAVALARFCAEEEAQTLMMRRSAYLPALASATASAEARRSDTPTLALADRVTLVARPTQTPRYPQVSKAVYTNVNPVLNGGRTAGAALTAARADMADALEGTYL